MKKKLLFVLLPFLAFGMASCGCQPGQQPTVDPTPQPDPTPDPDPDPDPDPTPDPDPEVGFCFKINGEIANLDNLAAEGGADKAHFQTELAEGDRVIILEDGVALEFAGVKGVALEETTAEFEAPEDATYDFYVNASSEIWVTYAKTSGLVEVNLYVKFALPDEDVELPAFAMIYEEGGSPVVSLAWHVAESWESSGNRHYMTTAENPLGKKIKFAMFASDTTYSAENLPVSFDDAAYQSGESTIEAWGADIN